MAKAKRYWAVYTFLKFSTLIYSLCKNIKWGKTNWQKFNEKLYLMEWSQQRGTQQNSTTFCLFHAKKTQIRARRRKLTRVMRKKVHVKTFICWTFMESTKEESNKVKKCYKMSWTTKNTSNSGEQNQQTKHIVPWRAHMLHNKNSSSAQPQNNYPTSSKKRTKINKRGVPAVVSRSADENV